MFTAGGNAVARNLITKADRDRVHELYAQGKTRNDIARALSRSP